jgi:hypothetical protein
VAAEASAARRLADGLAAGATIAVAEEDGAPTGFILIGAPDVFLHVSDFNHAAQAFYRRWGISRWARSRGMWWMG